MSDKNKGISIIEDGIGEDADIQYCPVCSEYRFKLHRLGPLIILDPKKPLPPDYDNWRQCGYCYTKVPIYEVRTEGQLFTDIEGVKNPFDFGVTKTEGVHKKGLHNRMKDITKKNKVKKDDYSDDKEVMNEVKDGAVVSGYFTSTSTSTSTDKTT